MCFTSGSTNTIDQRTGLYLSTSLYLSTKGHDYLSSWFSGRSWGSPVSPHVSKKAARSYRFFLTQHLTIKHGRPTPFRHPGRREIDQVTPSSLPSQGQGTSGPSYSYTPWVYPIQSQVRTNPIHPMTLGLNTHSKAPRNGTHGLLHAPQVSTVATWQRWDGSRVGKWKRIRRSIDVYPLVVPFGLYSMTIVNGQLQRRRN